MNIFGDINYALRLLVKRPGFTVLTILVMAVGIGLSVYLFSFFNSLLFKDLPFQDSSSLVRVLATTNGARRGARIDLHDLYEIRDSIDGLNELVIYQNKSVNVSGRDGARRFNAVASEPGLFRVTRTSPQLGRTFTDAENRPGAEYVVVLGHDIWQQLFAGDPAVIDRALRINGQSHRIVGVMPEDYYFPNLAELWLPTREDPVQLARGSGGQYHGVAHLDEGASVAEVTRQIETIMRRLEERYPKSNRGVSAYAEYFVLSTVGEGLGVVRSLYFVAILILILASMNVGNLLFSRAVERGKETAIRVALGAPRSRLISQMMWESVVICTIGGIIGLVVIAWGLGVTESVIKTFLPDKPLFWWKFGVDAYTLKVFFAFLIGTILLTGLLPAWRNTGTDFNAVLRDGTRGALGRKTGRLNRLLIVGEVFLSITILIAAASMVLASYIQTHADIGADTANVLTADVALTESDYDTPEKKIQFMETLRSRLENTTEIGDVMLSSTLPGVVGKPLFVALDGREYNDDRSYPEANYIAVSPGSLAKMGVELRQGRYLSSVDEGLDKKTVLITESFAKRNYPNESPLGKRLRIVSSTDDTVDWLTIVGVVEHTVHGTVNQDSGRVPSVFRPFSQFPRAQMTIAMKMKSSQAAATQILRRTLQSIDPDLPAFTIETFQAKVDRNSAPIRFISRLCLLFGIAAVILAASGIYGVMANVVSQRTHEIGVKRALGANEGHITREFLTMGLKQLLWGGVPGLLAGVALGFAMSRVMGTGTAALFVVSATILAVVGTVLMLATHLPTKRALSMEPSAALRYE